MNILKTSSLILAACLLCSCALTPEQKAARAKERAQELLNTQISLAKECSPQAAQLMAQMPTANELSPAAKQQFEANYNAQINNPTFQSCYKLAWQSYKEQNQLQIARMQEWDEANELDWENGMFFNGPFGYAGPYNPFFY